MKRSGQQIFRKIAPGRAIMRGFTTLSSNARWRARWHRRGLNARRSNWKTAPGARRFALQGRWYSFPVSWRCTRKAATIPMMRIRAACRCCATADAPAKKDVRSEQHFTQPPPRFSEASLVKQMEELGIGRPSTYASIIQVLKDRAYVRMEKNRFFAEETGRLLTAFLERFFEKYVEYDFTAGLEEELDDVSGGRAAWQAVLEPVLARFQTAHDRGDGLQTV